MSVKIGVVVLVCFHICGVSACAFAAVLLLRDPRSMSLRGLVRLSLYRPVTFEGRRNDDGEATCEPPSSWVAYQKFARL